MDAAAALFTDQPGVRTWDGTGSTTNDDENALVLQIRWFQMGSPTETRVRVHDPFWGGGGRYASVLEGGERG